MKASQRQSHSQSWSRTRTRTHSHSRNHKRFESVCRWRDVARPTDCAACSLCISCLHKPNSGQPSSGPDSALQPQDSLVVIVLLFVVTTASYEKNENRRKMLNQTQDPLCRALNLESFLFAVALRPIDRIWVDSTQEQCRKKSEIAKTSMKYSKNFNYAKQIAKSAYRV